MNIVELSVTLISIIIGIGLTEMFGNLHRLVRHRAQVRWDWLPVAWSAVLLVFVVNYWWAIQQGLIGLDRLSNAAELALSLIQPIVMFLLTASVLPNFGGSRRWDMRRHYDRNRQTFIATFVLFICVTWTTAIVVGSFGWNVASIIRASILGTLIVLLIANDRRWDWAGAAYIFAALIFRLTTQAMR